MDTTSSGRLGLTVFVLLLCLFGFFAPRTCADSSWRSKVSPDLLSRFDDFQDSPCRLLLGIAGYGASDPNSRGGSYVYQALTSWQAIGESGWVETFMSYRPADRIWARACPWQTFSEAFLPYQHCEGTLLVDALLSDIQHIAEMPEVRHIRDADICVAVSHQTGPLDSRTSDALEIGDLATGMDLTTEDFLETVAENGWVRLETEDIEHGQWEDPAAPLLESSGLDLPGERYTLISYARVVDNSQQGEGDPFDDTTVLGPWQGTLALADIVQLLDSMYWNDADVATLATVREGDHAQPFFALWRSAEPTAIASVGGGTSTLNTVEPIAPDAPRATLGTHGDRIVITWQAGNGANEYQILRASTSNSNYFPLAVVAATTYEDRDVDTCSPMWYRIRCLGHLGLGQSTNPVRGYAGLVPLPVEHTRASGITGGIQVEWSASENATHYRVLRNQYMSGSSRITAQNYEIGETTETSFMDMDVVVGQKYLYRVFALNACGRAELGPTAEAIAMFGLPPGSGISPPAWVEASRGTPYGQIDVTWSTVTGADEYVVLRGLSYAGPFEAVARTDRPRYVDIDVVLCGDYWYKVKACSGENESDPSATVYGSYGFRPDAPDHVRASINAYPDAIRIDWAPMEDAALYDISRAPSEDGPFATIGSTDQLYFIDVGLLRGQSLWYKVKASNPCGCSGDLGAVRGTTTSE